MNTYLVIGISAFVFLSYLAFRRCAEQHAMLTAYRRELRDLMMNEKYQVKGRFE